MAHDATKRAALRDQFVSHSKSIEDAAKLIGVAYSTARRWKQDALRLGDDWDSMRAHRLPLPVRSSDLLEAVATQAAQQCAAILDEIQGSKCSMSPLERAKILAVLLEALAKHRSMPRQRGGRRARSNSSR